MSRYLWNLYLQDDVAGFRRVLETSSYSTRGGAQKGHASGHGAGAGMVMGSPGGLGTSPTLLAKTRKSADASSTLTLRRTDINSRDDQGLTLLHSVASESSAIAYDFATALLDHPLTDIYLQDFENGWTALHRAFYAGNISVAHSILLRERRDAYEHGTKAVTLIRMKDREGNGPFDLFEMTLLDTHSNTPTLRKRTDSVSDEDSVPASSYMDRAFEAVRVIPFLNIDGDEVYTFGSNKNVTLGFGDEDDRQFPERVGLKRPDHLYHRFYREYLERATSLQQSVPASKDNSQDDTWLEDLPTVIRNRPIRIQDVQMSKFHSAILTTDPESNLYICGHGAGGRIGTGDESTRFHFTCIDGGALTHKKIASVALGQNHTLAISHEGEIFSWGSNAFGQLGYALPRSSKKDETIQTLPRQIFGPLKREVIVGIAASRLHSAAHTTTALYTFGKNEGQLGLVDADARSMEVQELPRRVGAALFSAPIKSVSAAECATICLLHNSEVWVFANYGYTRVTFPVDSFLDAFNFHSHGNAIFDATPRTITKVASGGDTVCTLTDTGEIFRVSISPPPTLPQPSTTSTTHPRQIRSALSPAVRIWANKKTHLEARDVDVDQNGSIILVTEAGSVWRRVKREKSKNVSTAGTGEHKPKDYKFSRISGLTRVTAVRASGFGAFAAVRSDCTILRDEINARGKTLASDIAKMSPLDFSNIESPHKPPNPSLISQTLVTISLSPNTVDEEINKYILQAPRSGLAYDLYLRTPASKIQIPVHKFVLACRSQILRRGFLVCQDEGTFSIPDALTIRKSHDRDEVIFEKLDVLTLIYLVLNLYSEEATLYNQLPLIPGLSAKHVPRHRQAQRDLLKLANILGMRQLTDAIDRSFKSTRVDLDIEQALRDPAFFATADVLIELADEEVPAHSALVCQRCPFFQGLFQGRAGGQWLVNRCQDLDESTGFVRIDLRHFESKVFEKVLRHIYADTGPELFDDVVAEDLDAFLDHVIAVMDVANELMLERLSEVCQEVVGEYVTTRNVCRLLNAIAPYAVTIFKERALKYICLNIEVMLQQGLLDELDEDTYFELDKTAQDMQISSSVVARARDHRHDQVQRTAGRHRSMNSDFLQSRYGDSETHIAASFGAGSFQENPDVSRRTRRSRPKMSDEAQPGSPSPMSSPELKGKRSTSDLFFGMEDDDEDHDELEVTTPSKQPRSGIPPRVGTSRMAQDGSSPYQNSNSNQDGYQPMMSAGSPSAKSKEPQPRNPERPWGVSPLPSTKLDMKAIMEQASTSQTSNLSLALVGSVQPIPRSTASGSFKISQKERKKMQQTPQTPTPSVTMPSPSARLSSSTVAWQNYQPKTKAVSPSLQSESATPSSDRAPQLTMRQTVANPGSAAKLKDQNASPQSQRRTASGPLPTTTASPVNHTKTSPQLARGPPTSPQGLAAASTKQPTIQSIRHMPMPERSIMSVGGLYSLSDILTEQEAAKNSIKDAAAKRSLQEIQQEQEFQEWWDKESARVREEEARKAKAPEGGNRSSSAGRRRGARGKGPRKENDRDKGKGKARTDSDGSVPRNIPDTSTKKR